MTIYEVGAVLVIMCCFECGMRSRHYTMKDCNWSISTFIAQKCLKMHNGLGPILTEIQNFFFNLQKKKESLQRYISQIYICHGKTVSRLLYVSANMCISLNKNICKVRFIYSMCLTIIITVMTMTNDRKNQTVGMSLTIWIKKRNNRAFC